jgi:hypothetical protein
MAGHSKSDAVSVALAALGKLNVEIADRSKAQQRILFLAVTAVGAIGGFTINNDKTHELALLIPLVSSMLGFLWLDHAYTIHRLGRFVQNEMWECLDGLTGESIPNWEKRGEQDASDRLARMAFVLPVSALLVGPSLATLVALHPGRLGPNWLLQLGWVSGAISVGALLLVLVPFVLVRGWWRPRPHSRAKPAAAVPDAVSG